MNRRIFLKVALGTIGVLLLDPIKVLSEKPTPKKDLDVKIEKTSVVSTVHKRKPELEIKSNRVPPKLANAKIIDLVRIAYPAITAQQLCSVQPMTAPTGEIFKIRYVRRPWYKRLFNWMMLKR